jgi:uncharacterized protein (UPF0333 family)
VAGVPGPERINPTLAFLLLFPGAILAVPYFLHYWYLTKHQNVALRAAGRAYAQVSAASPLPALGA